MIQFWLAEFQKHNFHLPASLNIVLQIFKVSKLKTLQNTIERHIKLHLGIRRLISAPGK